MKTLVLFVALSSAASAQLALFTFDGANETPVGSTYNYGNVVAASSAAPSNSDVRFHIHNTGTSPVSISTLTVSGAGFSVLAVNGTLPYPIAPGNLLEFTIRFNATLPATYSANLQVNSLSVFLLATVVTPAQLSPVSGCTAISQRSSAGGFDFGSVLFGTSFACGFSLYNPTGQPMIISTIALTGAFQFQQKPATPLTLAANQVIQFTIMITPVCGNAFYIGALLINSSQASQSFPLTAAGITPPTATPLITFDTGATGATQTFASAGQHTITLTLPATQPCGAAGNLTLAFTPLPGLPDDSAVAFIQGNTRSLQFSASPNSTAITIGGQTTATFQTGTTAGSIAFTFTGTGAAAGPAATITIPPALITIDTATASNQRIGDLDISVTGFDNTYSTGVMTFTFFDTTGKQLGSAISADFTAQFKTYYATQTGGSAFLVRISFPVTGNQALISTVKATLTNSVGTTPTGSLTFQ